jgi:hypothetical protein
MRLEGALLVDFSEAMFETICIRLQHETGNPVDLGFLAEALIFYGRVHVVADPEMFKFLVRTCGPEVLIDLLEAGFLTMVYLENHTGVITRDSGTQNERHSPILFSSPTQALQNLAPKLLQELTGRSGKGRRLAERLTKHISTALYPASLPDEMAEDVSNSEYVTKAVEQLLRYLAPEYQLPQPFVFNLIASVHDLRVETNIDFTLANESYNRRVSPSHSTLTPAYLISCIQDTRSDLYFSSDVSADLAVSPIHSIIATCKLNEILQPRKEAEETLELFEDFVFDDSRAIREAVNRRERSMIDVLSLVKKAEKFRKWVKDQPENTDLRKAYCKEVSSIEWAAKLPVRNIRFGLFTAMNRVASMVIHPPFGTIASIALSATNTFLIDKLIRGWKPNQFVEGPLRDFIVGRENNRFQ